MSAIVCGKRSFFEDLHTTPVSKKFRCSSSTSLVRFSPTSLFHQLSQTFPLMDHQILERTLEECGDDIDAAIKRLHELCIGSAEKSSGTTNLGEAQGGLSTEEQSAPTADSSSQNTCPIDGMQWVELFVTEMMGSSSVDDARARAANVLEVLEKSIRADAAAEVAQNYQKENDMLKQQLQALMNDNNILKRAVQIQHERHKEYEEKNQEAQQLKQLLSQYREQMTKLEMTNYNLSWHLKQAQTSSSVHRHFDPDIF